MDKFIVSGSIPLSGEVTVCGAKNVALKLIVASLLTREEVVLHNIPNIHDVFWMLELVKGMGATVMRDGNTVSISCRDVKTHIVSLDVGARLRTSSMVMGPMLARFGKAQIPNPGGCRIGARPIDRHIDGLRAMGATITYHSEDGYFYGEAEALSGSTISFTKNTHTGTESILLAAVLARGTTVIKNAAEEVEIDDLIAFLNKMGSKISRTHPREIVVEGVSKLHGAEYFIMPDRNEEVTFAIAAAITHGKVVVKNSRLTQLAPFLEVFTQAGGIYEIVDSTTTKYSSAPNLCPTDIVTSPHPGFMTDWQAPWAVLMTQADGTSTIHETVFESRFSYVSQLAKMGAKIEFFDPPVANPESYYNFNWKDRAPDSHQGVRIHGPTMLHNAVVTIEDLRAGATLILAALAAEEESYILGIEQVDRGYEAIETRLTAIGAKIKRITE